MKKEKEDNPIVWLPEIVSVDLLTQIYEKVLPLLQSWWQWFWELLDEKRDQIRLFFDDFFEDFAVVFKKKFERLFAFLERFTLDDVLKRVEPAWRDAVFDFIDKLHIPDHLKERLKKDYTEVNWIGWLIGGIAVIAIEIGWIGASAWAGLKKAQQDADEVTRFTIPDPATLITNYIRKPETEEKIRGWMHRLGFSDEAIGAFLTAVERYPDLALLRDMYFRGELSREEFIDRLIKEGFTPEYAERMERTMWYIPPPADLVRFAVREVFRPEIVEKYKMYLDWPKEFGEWSRKVGMDERWAKYYWYAHWVLPSAMQGFEMVHRRAKWEDGKVFDEEDMDALLRTLDIMPAFRTLLMQIAYRPLTRVDVRRMYAVGVLDPEGVYWAYRDLGYDHTNAERMRDFTIRYETAKERDLSKTDVLSAYEKEIIDKAEALDYLKRLGYSEEEALILTLRIEYKKLEKIKETRIKNLHSLYLRNEIEADTVYERLGDLGLPGKEIDALLHDWDREREDRIESLTKAEILDMMKWGVITEEEAFTRLRKLNYTEQTAHELIELTKKKPRR